MMSFKSSAWVVLGMLCANSALAQSPSASIIPVTVDNFSRAESDLYFRGLLKDSGGIGKFLHRREPARIDNQTVIRLNRDTLYSSAVFDLDAGPVTITLPDTGKRFMSMQVINEDHYVPEVVYGKGSYTLSKDKVGTRYVVAAIRTLVDPADPKDVEEVHGLQDVIKVSQKATGAFEAPDWDQASQKKVRDALLVLGSTIPDFKKAFGTKADVDPVRHLIGTAMGWGGNPDKDAIYLNVTPANNDGTTVYKLDVKDVPVDGFWSVSLYNAQGYYEKNPYEAYSINSITGKKSADGSIAVQFGGCDGKIPNCLPIMKGWNYTVRLYRPRAEIQSGKWKFPEPQPAS
ncbi:carboxylesterase [Bradyrhizobium sp. LTSP857]|nr:carboxylesterase [Bradyrhizobium sp. LTSP857]